MENAREQLQGRVTFASGPAECARQSDVLVITTPWPEFKKLTPQDFKRAAGKAVVLDCWRVQFTTTVSTGDSAAAPAGVRMRKRLPSGREIRRVPAGWEHPQ